MANLIPADLNETRVSFRDAMLLVENGYGIQQENIRYDDTDIVADPDFDDVEWNGDYQSLGNVLAENGAAYVASQNPETITVELTIKDQNLREWLAGKSNNLENIVSKLLEDLYRTEKLLR